MPEDSYPVFVVGPPRSGTTLVYSILLSSGAFPVYEAESRVLECASRYGRLTNARNFRSFERDFRRSRQFARSGLDPDRFFREAKRSCATYVDFLRFFMGSITAAQHKTRWAEKTPNHILHMRTLAREFPDAKFIHIVRDGRDVALSQRSVGMTARYTGDPLLQLVWGAKIWEVLATGGSRSGQRIGDRYLELRYEEVVSNLDETIERIGAFAEIDLDRERITGAEVGALGRANTMFDDPMHGVSQKAKERWRERLSEEEQQVVEWSIGGSLSRFGYRLSDLPAYAPTPKVRLHARLAPAALLTKRYLNRYTPIGRFGVKPLEIGLT